jgi:hypothetical protein
MRSIELGQKGGNLRVGLLALRTRCLCFDSPLAGVNTSLLGLAFDFSLAEMRSAIAPEQDDKRMLSFLSSANTLVVAKSAPQEHR